MHYLIASLLAVMLFGLIACSKQSDPISRIDDCKQHATNLLTQSFGLSKPPKIRWVVVEQQQEPTVQIQVVLGFRQALSDDGQDDGGAMNNLVCQYPYVPPIDGGEGEYEASPYGLVFNNQMISLNGK